MPAMAVMANLNRNTIADRSSHADSAAQLPGALHRTRLEKIKVEFRGLAREQRQYWIVGPNLHAGDQ